MTGPTRLPLSPRQTEVLEFIKQSVSQIGCPPTRREIADHLGCKSPNAADDLLKAMQGKGYIVLGSGGKTRAIKIID